VLHLASSLGAKSLAHRLALSFYIFHTPTLASSHHAPTNDRISPLTTAFPSTAFYPTHRPFSTLLRSTTLLPCGAKVSLPRTLTSLPIPDPGNRSSEGMTTALTVPNQNPPRGIMSAVAAIPLPPPATILTFTPTRRRPLSSREGQQSTLWHLYATPDSPTTPSPPGNSPSAWTATPSIATLFTVYNVRPVTERLSTGGGLSNPVR
jgi:hypothetical protein